MTLRVATRGSALARWQADHVATLLRVGAPDVKVEAVVIETLGDRRPHTPISAMGGKGVFAKEVQAAVLDGRADIAVHSAKDLPSVELPGLVLAAVPERGDPRDALVGSTLGDLPEGATVATGSNRRRVQLAGLRPDLAFAELRGNMHTRLEKAAGFDAIVVAAVALERLGLSDRITEVIDAEVLVPQAGQGALAVECRSDDEATRQWLARIEHPASRRCVDAERAFLAELGGDCELPAGAHATIGPDGRLHLAAVLAPRPGGLLVRHEAEGVDPVALGRDTGRHLKAAAHRRP